MKKIYVISADTLYPVGDAGGVILANDETEALKISNEIGLCDPRITRTIETTIPNSEESEVLFSNTTDY